MCLIFLLFFFAFVLPNVEDSHFWPIQSRLVKTVNPASELLFSQECGLLLSASFRLSVFGQSDPHLPALQAPVKVQTRADVGTSHFPIHHHLFSRCTFSGLLLFVGRCVPGGKKQTTSWTTGTCTGKEVRKPRLGKEEVSQDAGQQ